MEQDNIIRRRKKIFGVFAIFVGVIIAATFVGVLINLTHAYVKIKIMPPPAAVFIDGKKVKNNTDAFLTVGEHRIFAYMNGFEIYNNTFIVESGQEKTIIELLPAITEYGEGIKIEYAKDYYAIDTNNELDDTGGTIKPSAFDFLPYTNDKYGLGSVVENGDLKITITLYDNRFLDTAIEQLKSLFQNNDLNISEYDVRINDFLNPFNEVVVADSVTPEGYINELCNSLKLDCQISGGAFSGDYYHALATVVGSNPWRQSTYRIILKQENKKWKLASAIYPLLTTKNSPDMPVYLLNQANNLANRFNANSSE